MNRAIAALSLPVFGLLLCTFAPSALSLEVTASVQETSEYTTNTARTEDNEVEEWIHQPGIDLAASHSGAAITFDADYSFERRLYEEDLFEDENATTGSAQLVWQAIPQRLDFTVSNARLEATERAFAVDTQANRQTISVTEIGPLLRFQPRSGDELQLEYRYLDVNADETDTDSERHNGDLRYLLGLSSNRTVTFEGNYSDIDYDNDFTPDAESWTGMVGYRQTATDLDLDINAGYSSFNREGDFDEIDGAVYDLDLSWRTAGATTVALSASRGIQDLSSSLTDALNFDDTVNEDTDLNEVFVETRGEFSVSRAIGRTNVTVRVYASDEDYEDVARDSERIGVSLAINRNLSRRTTLSADVEFANREFTEIADDQDELRARIEFSHRLGRRLALSWGVRYEDRDADIGGSYDELIGMLQLSYTILGAASS